MTAEELAALMLAELEKNREALVVGPPSKALVDGTFDLVKIASAIIDRMCSPVT